MLKEPRFIRAARRAIEREAMGRPDPATYMEAGHAALNIVLTHYLDTPVLNPGLVSDERVARQRAHYERLLQQAADLLAAERRMVAQLRATVSETDSETGRPLVEALRRARDQATSARHAQEVAEAALRSGSPPIGKQAANARHERTLAEKIRLAERVRELEALLNHLGS